MPEERVPTTLPATETIPEFDQSLIGRPLAFSTGVQGDPTARESRIKIAEAGEYLGKGGYSEWIRQVTASTLDTDGTESPPYTFALKKFRYPDEKINAANALENYKTVKEAGLKTWTTYRVNEENNLILMTYGNFDGKTLFSPNNENHSPVGKSIAEQPLREIPNFYKIAEEMLAQALLAAEKKIYLNYDAYCFFIPDDAVQKRSADIDFIISDLDISTDGTIYEYGTLYRENVKEVIIALRQFLSRCAKKGGLAELYLQQATESANEKIRAYE